MNQAAADYSSFWIDFPTKEFLRLIWGVGVLILR